MTTAAAAVLVAALWIAMIWAPGGPDSAPRYVLAGVAAAIAFTSAGVAWASAAACSYSRPFPPAMGVAVACTMDVAALAAAVSCVDGRVGLMATAPLALISAPLALVADRVFVLAQTCAAVLVVAIATAVGVGDGGLSLSDIGPYAVQALFVTALVPGILHRGFAVAGAGESSQGSEPMRDTLTDVLTRHGLYAAAMTGLGALNRKDYLVVVRVHLDQFQDITVGDGRERGEQVLQRVASRLAHGVRGGDFVARTGDAEFSALAGVTHEGIEIFSNRFRELVFDVEDPVPVSASVGVAFARTPILDEDVHEAVDDLLHRAEVVMQAAQDAGGDRVEVDWNTPTSMVVPKL